MATPNTYRVCQPAQQRPGRDGGLNQQAQEQAEAEPTLCAMLF